MTLTFDLGGHDTCGWCGSSCSISVPSLKFIWLDVRKIWRILCVSIHWPGDLDLLTLKLVHKSHVCWRPFLLILGFLGFWFLSYSIRMLETKRQTDRQANRQKQCIMPLSYWGGHNNTHTHTHFSSFHQPFFGYIWVSQSSHKRVQSLWTFIQQYLHGGCPSCHPTSMSEHWKRYK